MRFISPAATIIKYLLFDHLQIEPTTRCNLSCVACPHKNGVPIYDITAMTLYEICAKHPSVKSIKLQGLGEPLMHPRFSHIVDVVRSWCDHIETFTNGTMYNQDVTNLLDAVTVSLDSIDPVMSKRFKGANYNVGTVLANIIEYNSRIPTVVNFTRTARNWSDEGAVNAWCRSNGIAFNVTRVQNWHEPNEPGYAAAFEECQRERVLFGEMPREEPRCLWKHAKLYYYRADGTRAPCCRRMNYRDYSKGCCSTCPD